MKKKEIKKEIRSAEYDELQKCLNFTLDWLGRGINLEKYLPGTLDVLVEIENDRLAALESGQTSEPLVLPYICEDGFPVMIELSEPDLSRIYFNKAEKFEARQFLRTVGGQPYEQPLLILHTAHAIMENKPITNWPSLPKVLSDTIRDHGMMEKY